MSCYAAAWPKGSVYELGFGYRLLKVDVRVKPRLQMTQNQRGLTHIALILAKAGRKTRQVGTGPGTVLV